MLKMARIGSFGCCILGVYRSTGIINTLCCNHGNDVIVTTAVVGMYVGRNIWGKRVSDIKL